jgi:hypothetical protein
MRIGVSSLRLIWCVCVVFAGVLSASLLGGMDGHPPPVHGSARPPTEAAGRPTSSAVNSNAFGVGQAAAAR